MARTDEQLKKDVVDNLYWDVRVDASKVNVEVADGEVFLKGTVPNYAAYWASEDDSWTVPEVLKVNNQLTVEYPDRTTIPSDDEIKTNIKSTLSWNPYIHEGNIDVSVNNGIVKLEGSVESYWKKLRAEELAYNIWGVLEVINELAVVPTRDIVDRVIGEDIMAAFDRNAFVDADSVDIKVENGKVTLSGGVTDQIAFRSAVDIVRNTPGVTDIVNNLFILR